MWWNSPASSGTGVKLNRVLIVDLLAQTLKHLFQALLLQERDPPPARVPGEGLRDIGFRQGQQFPEYTGQVFVAPFLIARFAVVVVGVADLRRFGGEWR